MDKLQMHTANKADENFKKLAALFPNAVTETINENGEVIRAIDKDVLMQEISCTVVEGKDERYQFTWPDKKKSVLLANAPISKTLRPCREESVDFDNTENLYIEGDNLEVLKLLQETYLGKIKMIYIDPPYNTGNDFVYEDDFAQSAEEYLENSGQVDENGNKRVTNTESNGRFHTDWLNMIYPRLRLGKDLLTDDGIVFIHIDEHEDYSLTLVCNEIFGQQNKLGTIIWDKRNPKGVVTGVAYQHESVLVYCKNITMFANVPFKKVKEHASDMLYKVSSLIKQEGEVNNNVRDKYKKWIKEKKCEFTGGEKAYTLIDDDGNIYQPVSMAAPDKPETRSHRPLLHPISQKPCPVPAKGWRFTDKKMDELLSLNKIEFGVDESTQPRQKYFLKENLDEAVSSLLYYGGSDDALGLPFDNPKPIAVVKKLISTLIADKDNYILDFFSGSSTTADAVMQLNSEDCGNRKFIMVQIPEETGSRSEAHKAGYKNICEIGKERIRRAGRKIKDELAVRYEKALEAQNEQSQRSLREGEESVEIPRDPATLDIGFRVLKCDTSNMKDVYYSPDEFNTSLLSYMSDNIKSDRTPEDLLFQVMLDLGVPLSSKIEESVISGKKVFSVAEGFLIACFDANVTEDTIKAIAQQTPYFFVMRDSSMASDSVATNFEQIFATYSPDTIRKVL